MSLENNMEKGLELSLETIDKFSRYLTKPAETNDFISKASDAKIVKVAALIGLFESDGFDSKYRASVAKKLDKVADGDGQLFYNTAMAIAILDILES